MSLCLANLINKTTKSTHRRLSITAESIIPTLSYVTIPFSPLSLLTPDSSCDGRFSHTPPQTPHFATSGPLTPGTRNTLGHHHSGQHHAHDPLSFVAPPPSYDQVGGHHMHPNQQQQQQHHGYGHYTGHQTHQQQLQHQSHHQQQQQQQLVPSSPSGSLHRELEKTTSERLE